MGEIYLARQTGVAGFQRQVVLKRVHRRLSDNPKAVEMFLGEARLAAALCHANIVQIYDVGEEDQSYFIVMERVTGASLRDLAEAATRQGQMIPMELSLTIMAQALEALRYAHTFRDETGQPLKIVHRDICPTNILVSFDGVVKIIDFGIARAENQIRQESGAAPGKFAYLAPEAILGQSVDGRSDLFSVGVLLYELTVGQRLFRAASYEAMRRVVNDPIPPPTFARAGYPVDLEILVMRALERDPADRFSSAEEMLEDLEQFAFDTGLRLSRLRLGRFVSKTMGVVGSNLLDAAAVAEELPQDDGPRGEVAQDELDFDNRGLFDGGQLDQRPAPSSSSALEAIQQANEAIAELVAADDEEEGETIEIRPSHQASLRADSVSADVDDSAVVVTDDLVEEVTDIEETQEEESELLLDRPTSGEPGRRLNLHEEITRPRHVELAPSADLKRALADISKDLEQAAASDRQRVEAIGGLITDSRAEKPGELRSSRPSGARDEAAELVGQLIGHPVAPGRVGAAASTPVPQRQVPSPTVDDELERVDREGDSKRPLDDLELSDRESTPEGLLEAEPEQLLEAEPEEDDSSILEPADPPEPGEAPEAEGSTSLAGDSDTESDEAGLDDQTIDLTDGDDELVEVRELEDVLDSLEDIDGLDDPTLEEAGGANTAAPPEGEQQPSDGKVKKRRRRGNKRGGRRKQ